MAKASHSREVAAEIARLSYATAWLTASQPELVTFRDWTDRYTHTRGAAARGKLLGDGVKLAQARRTVLAALIVSAPDEAIADTVPAAIRADLPVEVQALLETRVAGLGDYHLVSHPPKSVAKVASQQLELVGEGGLIYSAHIYGRREMELTKYAVSLHGIALDGELALHESPVRLVEPDEALDPKKKIFAFNPATGALTEVSAKTTSSATMVVVGGDYIACPRRRDVLALEGRLVRAESVVGPHVLPIPAALTAGSTPADTRAPWTIGAKNVLVIRIDFSDYPGEPVDFLGQPITVSSAKSLFDDKIRPFYKAASYAVASLDSVDTTSRVYRMPQTLAAYESIFSNYDVCIQDAKNAAAGDYALGNYDRFVVVVTAQPILTGGLPGSTWTFFGISDVGGDSALINGDFDYHIVAHELGHTFGLFHANCWLVADGDPTSPAGTSEEYGDKFDMMGDDDFSGGHPPTDAADKDFNPWFKQMLGWLPDSAIGEVTTSGVYRVYRFDSGYADVTHPLALRIRRDAQRDYWVGLRRNFPDIPSLTNGAYVVWGYTYNRTSDLLDLTTPGTNIYDAALSPGATLDDSLHGVTFTNLGEGGTTPNEYLDIQVVLSTPIANIEKWGTGAAGSFDYATPEVHAVELAAHNSHALALKSDGTVAAWGSNAFGQNNLPDALSGVVAVADGSAHCLALRSDGTVVGWGANDSGQATAPTGLSGVTAIAAGVDSSFAVTGPNGLVSCWGSNAFNQCSPPAGLSGVIAIAAGSGHVLTLNYKGHIVGWGRNDFGQVDRPFSPNVRFTAIAAGGRHSLALTAAGTVVAWGANDHGQTDVPSDLTGVIAIAAGEDHSLALKSDGTVVAWGGDDSQQCDVPRGLAGVSRIAAGNGFSLAIVGH